MRRHPMRPTNVPDAYQKIRAEHPTMPATQALAWARSMVTNEARRLDWHNDRAEFKSEGFHVVASIRPDEWGDVSWLGEFSDEWTPEAIPNEAWHGEIEYGYRYHRSPRYYVPCNSWRDNIPFHRASGMSRHEAYTTARGYALQDMKRLREYLNGERTQYVVGVRVFRRGIELGSAGVSGIDVDSLDDLYTTETVYDLLPEALKEARENLSALCSGRDD